MPYDVKLPDIGEGVAEGEIVRWLVKAGDRVREDQPLVEGMTDKASVEIPSPRTGVVAALLAEEGEVVNVGATIVSITVDGEDADAVSSSAGRSESTAQVHAGTASPRAATPAAVTTAAPRPQATPAVRELAKKLGVTLEALSGSGPAGAITADDVRRAAGALPTGVGASPTAPGAPLRDSAAVSSAAEPSAPAGSEERVPLRGLRRRIAEHMRRSIQTAAHFTFVAECDMTDVVRHRAALKSRAEAAGVKLTYLAYIVKALTASLHEYPTLNASLDDAAGEIVIKRSLNIGIATHTPEGLTVPIVHDADRRSLFDLAREIERLAGAARAGRLRLEELQGGTFTVTSTGSKGGVLATPILHHPQVAILGVHEVKPRPAVVDGAIVIRDLGNLSLSLDHRVVDGAVGADFLYDLIARLQRPAWADDPEAA